MADVNKMSRTELVEEIRILNGKISDLDESLSEMTLYSAIIEQTAESIAVTNIDGEYIYINKSYENLRGYSKDELNSKGYKEKYPQEEQKKRIIAYDELMKKGIWNGELEFLRKDGVTVPTLCITVLIRNRIGHPVAIAGILTDITDLKKAEEGFRKARDEADKANALKSHFLASTSHEIRTPMNAIVGFTDILLEDETDPQKAEYLEIIKSSGNLLLDLINDILDLSKIEAGKYELNKTLFSFRETIESIKNIFTPSMEKKNLSFSVIIEDSIPENMYGDQRNIRQVLINIVGNSIKFTKKGGITIACASAGSDVIIEVIDTGIGIGADKLDIIFAPFRQAEDTISSVYGGTGLGLSISRKLLDLMGGGISVKSQPGKGSSFTIRIPMAVGGSSRIERSDGQKSTGAEVIYNLPGDIRKDITILVAEDNAVNLKLIKTYLKKLNFEHDAAANGEIALEMLKNKEYHVLLLDIQMPVMDGIETIKAIRNDRELKNLAVIALTAHAMIGDEKKFLDLGFNDYISKPVDKKLLYEKILKSQQGN